MHDHGRDPWVRALLPWSLVATLSLLITAVGCEPGDREPAAAAAPPAKLTLDTVAVIHSDLLHSVECVRRGPDDNLVVMNMWPSEVLLLNTAGDLVGTVSRMGEGPGEFQALRDLDTKGDSILLLDTRAVLLFHRQSSVGTWSLRTLPGIPQQVAFTADGAPVVTAERGPPPDRENAMRVLRDTVEFYRVDDPETAIETPVEVPSGELLVSWNASDGIRVGMPAFAAWEVYDLTLTGVVAADARDGRVMSFDWGGHAARTLRPASPPTPASEAEMDRFWERVDARARRDLDSDYMTHARQSVDVWGGSVPRPFYSAVISDGSETLIGHYAHWSEDIVEWSLLDRNGKTLGTFNLGPGKRLLSLRDREVLGVGRDSMDVEHLLVLRIRKEANPPP